MTRILTYLITLNLVFVGSTQELDWPLEESGLEQGVQKLNLIIRQLPAFSQPIWYLNAYSFQLTIRNLKHRLNLFNKSLNRINQTSKRFSQSTLSNDMELTRNINLLFQIMYKIESRLSEVSDPIDIPYGNFKNYLFNGNRRSIKKRQVIHIGQGKGSLDYNGKRDLQDMFIKNGNGNVVNIGQGTFMNSVFNGKKRAVANSISK